MMYSRHNSKPSLKIVHTADVHLGDDYNPEGARRGFLAVLERTVAERADLLIIAGDMFDSNRAARFHLPFALSELSKLAIPIVLLPGNHDPYDAESVYRHIDLRVLCPHLHLITAPEGEVLRFPDLGLVLWGKPVIDHCAEFRPLGNIPSRHGECWHIAVAHGLHSPDGEETHRSSLIFNEEIAEAGWDYLALGHVHPYRDVSQGDVVACYSGSPSFTTAEMPCGRAVLVSLDAVTGVRAEPIELFQGAFL